MIDRTCEQCGALFSVFPSRLTSPQAGRFCSTTCANRAPRKQRPTITVEQILSRTVRSDAGCLLWTGSTRMDYGLITFRRRAWSVHRLVWTLVSGPIPAGLNVLHKCDTPPCCNPEHLFLGTQKDNAEDRERKHRSKHPAGQDHPMAKITESDVVEIRQLRERGLSTREIAKIYGIATVHAWQVVTRRTWRHV